MLVLLSLRSSVMVTTKLVNFERRFRRERYTLDFCTRMLSQTTERDIHLVVDRAETVIICLLSIAALLMSIIMQRFKLP
jgi:hypothetical protein